MIRGGGGGATCDLLTTSTINHTFSNIYSISNEISISMSEEHRNKPRIHVHLWAFKLHTVIHTFQGSKPPPHTHTHILWLIKTHVNNSEPKDKGQKKKKKIISSWAYMCYIELRKVRETFEKWCERGWDNLKFINNIVRYIANPEPLGRYCPWNLPFEFWCHNFTKSSSGPGFLEVYMVNWGYFGRFSVFYCFHQYHRNDELNHGFMTEL